jgi:hypothetical protein
LSELLRNGNKIGIISNALRFIQAGDREQFTGNIGKLRVVKLEKAVPVELVLQLLL